MSDEIIEAPAAEATADLVITTSKKRIKRLFGGTASVDMFFDGNAAPVCKDVKTHPWFIEFLKGKFAGLSWNNGGFSKDSGVPDGGTTENDFLYLGGPGMGWNGIAPVDCNEKQGELCKDYRIASQNVDFWGSHMLLRNMMGAENYIIANIYKGDLPQLFHQITATLPQKSIFIQFGEETGAMNFSNGAAYATQCYAWADAIKAQFPQQKFRFGFFCPTLWNKEKGVSEKAQIWADQILSVKPLDKNKWFVNQYCHGFDMFSFTGDIDHDIADVTHAVDVLMPAFSQTLAKSVFAGMKVFIGQVSAVSFSGMPYNSPVTKNVQYLVNWYARQTKHFIESMRDGLVPYAGQCFIGMNSWINKQLTQNLDFRYVSVMNNLWKQGLKALFVSSIDPEVDIYGGFKDDVYRIVIQNRSGRDIPFPATVSLDGRVIAFTPTKCVGVACAAKNSTTCTDNDAVAHGGFAGFGIWYMELS